MKSNDDSSNASWRQMCLMQRISLLSPTSVILIDTFMQKKIWVEKESSTIPLKCCPYKTANK